MSFYWYQLMGKGLMTLSGMLVFLMLLALTGCATTGSAAGVVDTSGVDVPSLVFRPHEFVKPVDNSSEGLFSALAQNKGVLSSAEYDRQLLEAFMRISALAKAPITIHEVSP